jgi:hypothetical protein
MGLPTIGTNWGGQVDFMKKDNSYLLDVESMDPISTDEADQNLKYATPSIPHLRKLMRHLVNVRILIKSHLFRIQKKERKLGKELENILLKISAKRNLGTW